MLILRSEDLARGSRPGVTVWQRRRTPVSSRELVVAWDDLVLIRPRIRFPEGCEPRTESTWSEGVRVTWSRPLWRYLYLSPVPVFDLLPAEELGPEAGVAVRVGPAESRSDPLPVVGGERTIHRLSRVTGRRLERAIGGALRWRLADLSGRPMLLGWLGRGPHLRVVAAPLP